MFCRYCHCEFPVTEYKPGDAVFCANCSFEQSGMEMPVQCICPVCEKYVNVPLFMVGGESDCPHCGENILLHLGKKAVNYFPELKHRADTLKNCSLKPGDCVGKYRVIRCLGVGGMGEVYLVEHTLLNSHFALKLFSSSTLDDSEMRIRLLREARIAGNIHHNNLIAVSDVELDNGGDSAYIVMEYVDGVSVEQLLEYAPISEIRTLEIIRDVGQALAAASAHHIIHRDIKPANIMISVDGTVKLADLGIAKVAGQNMDKVAVTLDNVVLGTPNYASPEQLKSSNQVDSRSDIYSLGVTMHHMLTGELPFNADSVYGIIVKVMNEPLVPIKKVRPEISRGVSDLAARMYAPDIEQRPQSIEEVLVLLEAELAKLRRPRWWKWIVPAAVAAGCVILIAALTVMLFSCRKDKPVKGKTEVVENTVVPVTVKTEEPAVVPLKDDAKTGKQQTTADKNFERRASELLIALSGSTGTENVNLSDVPEMLKKIARPQAEQLKSETAEYFLRRCQYLLDQENYRELGEFFNACSWLDSPRCVELRKSLPTQLREVMIRAVRQEKRTIVRQIGQMFRRDFANTAFAPIADLLVEFERCFIRCDYRGCVKYTAKGKSDPEAVEVMKERLNNIRRYEEERLRREIHNAFDKEEYPDMKELITELEVLSPRSSFVRYFKRKSAHCSGSKRDMPRELAQLYFNNALLAGDVRRVKKALNRGASPLRKVINEDSGEQMSIIAKAMKRLSCMGQGFSRRRMTAAVIVALDSGVELSESEIELKNSIEELRDIF